MTVVFLFVDKKESMALLAGREYPLVSRLDCLTDSSLYFSQLVEDIRHYVLTPYLTNLRHPVGRLWQEPELIRRMLWCYDTSPELIFLTNGDMLSCNYEAFSITRWSLTGHHAPEVLWEDEDDLYSRPQYDRQTDTLYLTCGDTNYQVSHISTCHSVEQFRTQLQVVPGDRAGPVGDPSLSFADPVWVPWSRHYDPALVASDPPCHRVKIRLAGQPEVEFTFRQFMATPWEVGFGYFGGYLFVRYRVIGQTNCILDVYRVVE